MSELTLYKRMYSGLFGDVTNVIIALDTMITDFKDMRGDIKEDLLGIEIERAIENLRKAQRKAEQIYIDG